MSNAHVKIDPYETHQTMEGWGASSCFQEDLLTDLQEPQRSEVYDLIFKDLGANILRVRIYSEFQPEEGGQFNWDCMADQRKILKEALSRDTIDTVWAAVWSPPAWMKTNNDVANGGHIVRECYDEYAAYLSTYVQGMKDTYGIEVHGLSPYNEPGVSTSYESTQTTAEECVELMKVMGTWFKGRDKLPTRLFGPDTMNINSVKTGCLGAGYVPSLIDDLQSWRYLDTIVTHQYNDTGQEDWQDLRNVAHGAGKAIWQSEVARLQDATHDMDGALEIAWWIWRAVTLGDATAWHHWQYYWKHTPDKAQGLVQLQKDGTYIVPPRYYVFKHWAKHAPKGSVRIDAACDNNDLFVAGFRLDDSINMIVFNRTDSPIEASFHCDDAEGQAGHIRTSEGERYVDQPSIHISEESFSTVIAATSISSFAVPLVVAKESLRPTEQTIEDRKSDGPASVILNTKIKHQTMDGFGGASCFMLEELVGMTEPARSEAYDLIFKDLGANILRLRLLPEFLPHKGAPFNWDCMENQRKIVKAALERGVIDCVWVAVWSPPAWMKDSKNTCFGGRLKPEFYGVFAEYLGEYVREMENEFDIPINAVSIFNEPGYVSKHETTSTGPEEYRAILKAVGHYFDSQGMKQLLLGPDTNNPRVAMKYLPTILGDPEAAGYLDAVLVHQYTDMDDQDWEGLRDFIRPHGKKLWQGEMSRLKDATNDINDGLEVCRWIYNAVVRGDAASWQYWQFTNQFNSTNASGLVRIISPNEYECFPVYYCFKQWSANVRSGSVRIEAKSSRKDLKTAAFERDGMLVVVVFNEGDSDIPTTFSLDSKYGKAQHIRTSAGENYARQPDLAINGNEFDITVKGKSVSTFLLSE
ncbi:glycoside hydrolase [Candidatus Hydrogenedentota bacterium]